MKIKFFVTKKLQLTNVTVYGKVVPGLFEIKIV